MLNRQLLVGAATTAVILCGDRLSQNNETQQVKPATMKVYTFAACKMWFRNYYVAYAFVVCVKISNEELVCNAFPFENSYYFSSG